MIITKLPKESGIYQIVNTSTEKRYVGYATNIRTRINGHKYELRRGIHKNNYLQKAFIKYREHNFTFKVLELCKKEDMCAREDYWVSILLVRDRNFGYNIKPTDPNGIAGQSEQTKEKLRLANIGKKRPIGWKNPRALIPMTKENKAKMKIARSLVDYKEVHRSKKGKPVIDIKSGKIYRSLTELAEEINVLKSTLCKKLVGTRTNNTNYRYL